VAANNSPSTRAVFEAKKCQGGGVTWAGLLNVLVQRRGSSRAVAEVTPGWTGDVRTLSWDGGIARFAIDDEGDTARFCADSALLVSDIQNEVKRLNTEPAELERTMKEANPLALECTPPGASISGLLKGLNPSPPVFPAEARAREEGLARMRALLAKQRTWCWGKGGARFGAKGGGFTLHPDGRVTEFGSGPSLQVGRWHFEEDGRIEVFLPSGGLHHFDVDEKSSFGFNHTEGRENLLPCAPP